MLESNTLLNNLLKIAGKTDNDVKRNLTLDILLWIITIRMARFRFPKNEYRKAASKKPETTTSPPVCFDHNQQQVECVRAIEENLTNLILSCIVFGNRTTAHKCVKIVMTASEGVQNLPAAKKVTLNFEKILEKSILDTLPNIVNTKQAGAMRWFMLLISSVSTSDSHGSIAETCIALLMKVVTEMENRWNPFTSLLKTRFGLYGSPFEQELFDAELPLPSKLSNLPVSIASVLKSSSIPNHHQQQHTQNQSIDLKHFCVSEGTELRILPFQLRQRGIGNHLKGLLEVEPLHFACYCASEATRIENMDSLSSSSSGNVTEDIIFEAPFEIDSMTNSNTGTTNAGTTTTTNMVVNETESKKNDDKMNAQDDMMKNVIMLECNNVKNILFDKIFHTSYKKHKMAAAAKENNKGKGTGILDENMGKRVQHLRT